MTVGELIRELSHWSPDTPVELTGTGPLGVRFTNPDFHLEYGDSPHIASSDIHPDTLYIVEEL